MRVGRGDHHKRGSFAVFLVTGVVIGAFMITPAGAHISESFNHLWNKHIKPKIATPGTINSASNPVDWTKLKGVPDEIADGLDSTGGPPGPATDVQCAGCVTSSDLGTLTVRTASVLITGGTGGNGDYILDTVQRSCNAGEEAISWSAFWNGVNGDLNGAGPGGADDLELTVASVQFRVDNNNLQGYTAWGGNDSGANYTFTLQVSCLAA